MNEKSEICKFINEHGEDWKNQLKEMDIRIKENAPYAIFNYGHDADFDNPIVQEARGIIINTNTLEVACWPFRKFGNFFEYYADKIDWGSAKVQEKVDGSIIKLWHSKELNGWVYSTNGMIFATEATSESGKSFMDMISETPEFNILSDMMNNRELDYNLTYIFELTGPDNTVVVSYDKPSLTHTGTRNNLTGEELNITIPGIRKPDMYPLSSLDECIAGANALNKNLDEGITGEGFVVVDKNWNRVKVKSEDYRFIHHLMENGDLQKDKFVEVIRDGKYSCDKLIAMCPGRKEQFLNCYEEMKRTERDVKELCDKVDSLVDKYGKDNRKEIALEIKGSPYAHIGFRHLDKGESAEDILNGMNGKEYVKTMESMEKRQRREEKKKETSKQKEGLSL